MVEFVIGFLALALIGILWMAWEIKHTPVSPDDGTGDVDYDEFVKDMKIEQDIYLNDKEQE